MLPEKSCFTPRTSQEPPTKSVRQSLAHRGVGMDLRISLLQLFQDERGHLVHLREDETQEKGVEMFATSKEIVPIVPFVD